MGIPSHPSLATSWTAGTMVLLLSAVGDFTVAPVVYTIVSEIPSTRLRAKSIILARNAYNIINLAFVNIVSLRQFNPLAWNWGPKACFFWAGINLLMNTYLYYRLRKHYSNLDKIKYSNVLCYSGN
jgi:SP family general alpha glucoside:H+ symporter-like MFS transporter